MAKGQKRSSKEARKPKSADKKSGPKYLASAGLGQSGKPGVSGLGQKK
jgi:hypothetical protein